MTLREKLMHYTHDLDCGVDLKQEAIATIEHIAQYMGEDELLHHSRPLAIAYLALTEDASGSVVRCKDCKHKGWVQEPCHGKSVDYCKVWDCTLRNLETTFCSYGERKDGADG